MYQTERPVYQGMATGKDFSKAAKAIIYPIAVFLFCIVAISSFKNFGKLLMTPLIGGMWMCGAACAFYMPSHRKNIINETMVTIASYCGTLLGFQKVISLASGVSAEMLMATFGQSMPTASANTLPGALQNMLWMSSVLIPLGFFTMQFKRILQFRKNINKQKKLNQLRGLR